MNSEPFCEAGLQGASLFSHIVALLILTGQRRGEIAALKWEWIDETQRTITLPASLTKNKRTHTFPYAGIVSRSLAAHSASKRISVSSRPGDH